MTNYLKALFILLLLFISSNAIAIKAPAIQLATPYKAQYNISQYWISEKLDGVRGYWDGKVLLTKNGNPLNPPTWFTANWPDAAIDGELWIKRHTFEQVISCVKKKEAQPCWQNIKFMIFDLPESKQNFSQRIEEINTLVKQVESPYFQAVQQFKLLTIDALNQKLAEVVKIEGEGLMLHYENAFYSTGRTKNIMKLKLYQDAEAIVIKHHKGKGKYLNMLGAIQVRTMDGIIFKIGSGFSDDERKTPPPVGSIITYKYLGKTQKGVPKFASFLRIRGKE
ncbi:DNA ligase [Pseudocolwellia sp. HL-MZ7]|uniref:DNA ligase n=1 Tax=Pseudocolwellia sp. HL-MZ7 TaxID=3400627 RepID=UPI003CF668EB